MKKKPISLSIVVPVYSGEKFLRHLTHELQRVKEAWEASNFPVALVEAVFVDDASVDSSNAILAELIKEHQWLQVVTLSRNFGQHPATAAGILHTTGDWVATLDEDLQHPPSSLQAMLLKAAVEKADVVFGKPTSGVHGSSTRDSTSAAIKHVVAMLTSRPEVKDFNSFRVIRGRIARAAAAVCQHQVYFDMVLLWFTGSTTTLEIDQKDHRFQESGASGYTFWKLVEHATRLLTSSNLRVLRYGFLISILSIILSILLAFWVSFLRLFGGIETQGWTSIMVTIFFFGGVGLLLIGTILEYLSIVLLQAQGKPTFFIVDRESDTYLREFATRAN